MTDIVVFDDSRTVRMFVEMSLGQLGYQVEAFAELGEFQPSDDDAPQLVLLDVHMDEFLGTDLLAHIRQNWPDGTLIYLYSDVAEDQLRDTMHSVGADGYIAKSWGFEGLVKTVRNVIKPAGNEAR